MKTEIRSRTARTAVGVTLTLLSLGASDVSGALQQTTIDRVLCNGSPCKNPIELDAGERKTLTLRGQGLGQISAGAVAAIGQGRVSSPVTVTLGQAGPRGTSREVTLSASAGALDTQGLRLQFSLRPSGTVIAPTQIAVVVQSASVVSTRPAVTSAYPASVDLEPGSTQTIVLRGANLDQLRDARIVRGRGVPGGLSAELEAPSGPGQRSLVVDAQTGLWPLAMVNVPLVVEVSGPNGTWVSTPAKLYVSTPDLSVRRVTRAPTPGASRVEVEIRNVGRAAARFTPGATVFRLFAGQASVDDPPGPTRSCDNRFRCTTTFPGPPVQPEVTYSNTSYLRIDPGQTLRIAVITDEAALPAGTYSWIVELDPLALVGDRDPSNNSGTVTFSIAAPAPPALPDSR